MLHRQKQQIRSTAYLLARTGQVYAAAVQHLVLAILCHLRCAGDLSAHVVEHLGPCGAL